MHSDSIRTWTPTTQIIRHATRRDPDTSIAGGSLTVDTRRNIRNKQIAAHSRYVEVSQASAGNIVAAPIATIVRIAEADIISYNVLIALRLDQGVGAWIFDGCCTGASEG